MNAAEMTEEEMLKIFQRNRPRLFDHFFMECKHCYDFEHNFTTYYNPSDKEHFDVDNNEVLLAYAIICDYGDNVALKIAKILLTATE